MHLIPFGDKIGTVEKIGGTSHTCQQSAQSSRHVEYELQCVPVVIALERGPGHYQAHMPGTLLSLVSQHHLIQDRFHKQSMPSLDK